MKAFAYARPESVEQVLQLISPTQRPKGGGFDLLDLAKRGVSTPDVLVDLSRVSGTDPKALVGMALGDHGEVTIGARVTLSQIAQSADIAENCPALADAAREAATPQVRNAATIAGNLLQRPRCAYFRDPFFDCRKRGGTTCPAMEGVHDEMAVFGNGLCCATHPSNLAVVLAAVRAEALIASSDRSKDAGKGAGAVAWRSTEIDSAFFVRPEEDPLREARVAPGELVWQITVPRAAASAYVEINHKQSYDWALVSCCAALDVFEGRIRSSRIVLGGVAPVPWRAEAAEQALISKSATMEATRLAAIREAGAAAAKGATPLRDNRSKVRLIEVVVRRAIAAAYARAK